MSAKVALPRINVAKTTKNYLENDEKTTGLLVVGYLANDGWYPGNYILNCYLMLKIIIVLKSISINLLLKIYILATYTVSGKIR